MIRANVLFVTASGVTRLWRARRLIERNRMAPLKKKRNPKRSFALDVVHRINNTQFVGGPFRVYRAHVDRPIDSSTR